MTTSERDTLAEILGSLDQDTRMLGYVIFLELPQNDKTTVWDTFIDDHIGRNGHAASKADYISLHTWIEIITDFVKRKSP